VRTGGSKLEDIPGVGPQEAGPLLQRFGGVRGVAACQRGRPGQVDGISRELAEDHLPRTALPRH
jgi:excinuclease ABC subunit C